MPDEETVPSRADIPAAAQRAAQQLALAYYEAGLDHGSTSDKTRPRPTTRPAGQASLAQQAVTAPPPYDKLCSNAEEDERAEQHRCFMPERGITPDGVAQTPLTPLLVP